MKKYQHTLPTLAILLACLIWGLNGVFVKTLDLPHAQQTFFRVLVPFIFTGMMLFFQKGEKLHRRFTKFEFFTISGADALRLYLLTIGFLMTTVGNSVIAQRSNTFIILILAYFILGEKLTWQKFFSAAIGFIGIIIIAVEKGISLDNHDFLGICAIMGSAAISSYLNIQYKQKIHTIGATNTIFLQSCLGVVVFGIFSFFNYSFPDSEKLFLALTHSFLIGVVGFYLFFWGLRHMEASKATILIYFEVFSGVFFGYMILGQIPSWHTYIGIICIVISGLILSLKSK